MKWRPQFEYLVSINRDAGSLSILHCTRELPNRWRLLAVALALIAWVMFDRSDPFLLVLVVAAYPISRIETLRVTLSGFDFMGGPSFTREEFIRAVPTATGQITFEFRGGQSRIHFRRLSQIQAAQIIDAVSRFLTPPGEPAPPTPASSQR
mgnify:CR=1 FL=1